MTKADTSDFVLFFLFIIGLFASHTILSYSIIVPAYFLLLIRPFLINKFTVDIKYLIVSSIMLLNVPVQLIYNPSYNTIFYSVILTVGTIVYYNISKLNLDKNLISKISLLFIILFLFHPSILNAEEQYSSYFKNANSLAGVYMMLFFIIEITGKKRIRIFNWLILLPIYLLIIESRSLVLGVGIYLMFLLAQKIKMQNVLLVVLIFIFYLMFIFYINPEDNFLIKLLSYFGADDIKVFGSNITYGAKRELLWSTAVNNNASFWYGVGFGNSNAFIERTIGHNLSPHNTLLKLYLEGGILFVISYVTVLIYTYRNSKSNITKAFIVAIQVRMFFESGFPFGISLASALLIIPFFIEKSLTRKKDEEHNISYS